MADQEPPTWNATLYDEKHAFVHRLGEGVIEWLAPMPGERIIDLGCGTGHLTAKIAASGARVLGLDNAREMIDRAATLHPSLEFRLADAADFTVARPVDAVFSNATLHWVRRAEDAARSIARSLAHGGRFVAEFGGRGNVAAIVEALAAEVPLTADGPWRHPWYYPSIGEYAPMIEKHGLETRRAVLFDRETRLEDGERGLRNWLDMFVRDSLAWLAPARIDALWRRVEERLAGQLWRDGAWHADYRRLRIEAVKRR